MSNFPEETAAAIFRIAIAEGRAGELLDHLFEGGGVTLARSPGGGRVTLGLIAASELERLARGE